MAFSNTIKLVLPLFLLIVLANKVVPQGDTTTFTYDSFSTSVGTLKYEGDASVPSSSSFARLTKAVSSGKPGTNSIGRIVHSSPVKFWEQGLQATFETTIKFVITPAGDASPPGDGLTFFIAPVDSPIPRGSTGGSFGIFDVNTGLAPSVFAVEFDTVGPYPNMLGPNK